MSENQVFHICTEQSWRVQLRNEYYAHASLASEGFIHCSNASQLEGVLSRYFDGQVNLMKLTINGDLQERLVYEAATNGELYPHIYGPISRKAIIEVEKIR